MLRSSFIGYGGAEAGWGRGSRARFGWGVADGGRDPGGAGGVQAGRPRGELGRGECRATEPDQAAPAGAAGATVGSRAGLHPPPELAMPDGTRLNL